MKCNAATKTVILLTTILMGILTACRHEKAVTGSPRPAEPYTPVATAPTATLAKPTPKAIAPVAAKPVRQWSTYEYYQQALAELEQLLSNPRPDFKRAVFITENAYYKQTLDYKAFQMQVDALTALCKSWMRANTANNYQGVDSIHMLKNQAIYTLMNDTVFLFEDIALHYPYRYNFAGLQSPDQTSQFVTRLLASGTGNCHAMPYLYKILADELGAKAWLSLAPNHIYLKQYSPKLGWYNTELTSSTFPTDAWVKASGYITLDAIRSGMYMDTLSHSQSVAMCAFDLAKGYLAQTADDTSNLVLRCCNLVLRYQPLHTGALVLKAETLRKRYAIQANPAVKQEMQACYHKALKGGYRQMPTALYQDWLSTPSTQASVYQPANPFAGIGKKGKVVTLSRGRYPEVQANDSLQPIGPVIVSMNSGEVKQLLDREEESLPDATLVNRWYSVDPLAAKYPGMSPYGSFNNNPIYYVDPTGESGVAYKTDQTGKDGKPVLRVVSNIYIYGEGATEANARTIQTNAMAQYNNNGDYFTATVDGVEYEVHFEINVSVIDIKDVDAKLVEGGYGHLNAENNFYEVRDDITQAGNTLTSELAPGGNTGVLKTSEIETPTPSHELNHSYGGLDKDIDDNGETLLEENDIAVQSKNSKVPGDRRVTQENIDAIFTNVSFGDGANKTNVGTPRPQLFDINTSFKVVPPPKK